MKNGVAPAQFAPGFANPLLTGAGPLECWTLDRRRQGDEINRPTETLAILSDQPKIRLMVGGRNAGRQRQITMHGASEMSFGVAHCYYVSLQKVKSFSVVPYNYAQRKCFSIQLLLSIPEFRLPKHIIYAKVIRFLLTAFSELKVDT